MRKLRYSPWLAGLFLLAAVPAFAQAPAGAPVRIRGTVESLDGNTLAVKSREGQDLKIALAPNYTVTAVVKKSLSDIKDGDFVASTGMKKDGKLYAVEVRIFPEALRGRGEGQYPWDLMPGSTMTNATVTGSSTVSDGKVLKVKYKGEESDFIVGPNCPVFGYVNADSSLLKKGAYVFLIANKGADGALSAAGVTAEKDGVKPPQ
ncbi:MAG TPA: hypothetical protein VMQ11_11385 [Alphaproteobacteria bacterium]|nr:hypothetical protein [Alphaproteobacteria bacterium]